MNRFTSFTFILILILCSCSVEKRTFNRGYHISWNKQLRHSAPTEGITEDELAENEIKPTQKTDEELNVEPLNLESLEPLEYSPAGDQNLNVESFESFEPSSEDFILAENPTASPDTVYYYPKFEPFGIASFASAGVALITFFTGIGAIVGFFLAVAGIIFGAISLSRYKNTPELYKANGFGIAGFILSLLIVLFTIIAFAILIAIFL